MPKLNCGVSNCANNADECCCLGQIGVNGSQAHSSEQTCCGNFLEKTGTTNCTGNANPYLSVQCDACDCKNNVNNQCCAESIDISGYGANNSVDTACSSFCQA